MFLFLLAITAGLALLVWSADKFIEGAAVTAKFAGLPPLLIGMVVVGFGTSAPEMVVSAIASTEGNPNLALGNALGSNIVNISLIVGLTALLSPIAVHSDIIKKEMPVMLAITLLLGYFLFDGGLSRFDATVLLSGFFLILGWTVYAAYRTKNDALKPAFDAEVAASDRTLKSGLIWLFIGLVMLILSSRLLVWGAVEMAHALGVNDLIIGLTIVALGTSLPELAASIIATRKGEHDIAIGNIVGSNMFNMLAVVGIAGIIQPIPSLSAEVMNRDWPVMSGLTLALFVMAYGFGKPGRINRVEGGLLLVTYVGYTAYLIYTALLT